MIDSITPFQIIEIIVTIATITGVIAYAKMHLNRFTQFIVALNDALVDDHVTNEEYVKIWQAWTAFLAGLGPKPSKTV